MTTDELLSAVREDVERVLMRLNAYQAGLPKPSAPVHRLASPALFFDSVRKTPPLGPTLTPDEVSGCEAILAACEGWPVSWAAYALATATHETAGTLRPIAEYGKGHGRPYGVSTRPDGQVAYGRGYVQLTWDANYEKADKELGLDGRLIANYELALDPDIAARILRGGMEVGWFTGKGLATYLPPTATLAQFTDARRIINGTDKAELIAGYAVNFQTALQAGGWG